MTHSPNTTIFPFRCLNLLNRLVSYIILLEMARGLSRFCKMARRSKVHGPGAQPGFHFGGGGKFHEFLFDDVIVFIQP